MAAVVPHQVPAAPMRFVNRDDELEAIRRIVAASGPAPTVVVCTGLPGAGKTALVRKAVEWCADFTGGELLVEFGPEVSTADALAGCLAALGADPKSLPAQLGELAALFRSMTASAPVLVVLDDVEEPAQVLPLIPLARGSVVLVTSVALLTELQLDGAEVIQVEPLLGDQGVRMLSQLSGRDLTGEPVVTHLVELCGGLPAVLRAAAARLRRLPGLAVEELAAEIEREHDTVVPVFSLVYRRLSERAAALYRLLGALPTADLALDAVGPVTGGTAREVEELVEAGLLQAEGARLRTHSLIRRHARDRAEAEVPEPERLAVVRRFFDWLLEHAAYADLKVLGKGRYRCTPHDRLLSGANPFADGRAALDWLDGERGNLVLAVRVAADLGWHDLAWQLAESATALYVERRYLVDWTGSSERGAAAAALAGNAAAEARLRSFVSRPWTELGDLPRARRELDAALALLPGVDDGRLHASVHEMDARYHDVTGDFAAAAAAFDRSLVGFRAAGDDRGEAFVRYFLGMALLRAGDLESAVDTLEAAVEPVRAQNNPRMTGRTLLGLAEAQRASGVSPRARLGEAVDVLSAAGDLVYQAQARELLADLVLADGDVDLARQNLREARDLRIRLGGDGVAELERRLLELP